MKILILCTGNSCRSQMADGLLKEYFKNFEIYSAGTKPETVNPLAIRVMREIGIDISKNKSNSAKEYDDINFDFVFTVCDNAKEICPVYPKAKKLIHQSFLDPAYATGTETEQLEVYRKVRDKLKKYFLNIFKDKIINT